MTISSKQNMLIFVSRKMKMIRKPSSIVSKFQPLGLRTCYMQHGFQQLAANLGVFCLIKALAHAVA